MAQVFTYGSLMFDAVWNRVVRQRHVAQRARLHGYCRHALSGRDYPGIVAAPGQSVDGVLWQDVSQADLARLDIFEGDEYRRITVAVVLADTGDALAAQTYLYTGPDLLPGQGWDPAHFVIERFLQANPPT